jgi:MFS superfamily sulfate permease-like transporter
MYVPTHRFAMKDLAGFICGFVVVLFLQSATQYYQGRDVIPSKLAAIVGLTAALAIICRHIFDLLNLYHSMHTLEQFQTPGRPWPFILSILSNIGEFGIVMICYFVLTAVSPPSNA